MVAVQAGDVGGGQELASRPARVLLVDGHSLFREGLRRLIESGLPGCQVLALADLEDLPEPVADQGHFDLLILDLDHRQFTAAAALVEGRRRCGPIPVAVLLDRETSVQVEAILALAPQALIHKTAALAQILHGLGRLLPQALPQGGPQVPDVHPADRPIEASAPAVGPLHIGQPRTPTPAPGPAFGDGESLWASGAELWSDTGLVFRPDNLDDLRAELSARQFDVLCLMAGGRTNKQISRELGLAESTIKTHVIAIFQKLKVNSRTEATLLAGRFGLGIEPRASAQDPRGPNRQAASAA